MIAFIRKKWAPLALCALLCAPAVWQLWLATSVFLGRYDYPFDIDWLESSALYQSWRMMQGQFTYDGPERGYLPLFHPIGYPALLAGLGKIFGLDYAMARIVSFAAFVATIGIASLAVARHATHDRISGVMLAVLAAGLAAACLPFVGGFYDLVRCDTVSWLCCALAAAIATRDRPSNQRLALLALVMTAGVYTRLLTVFPLTWVGLVVLWRDRREGMRLAAFVIGGCAVVLAGLMLMSHGWYWTYTVTLLQRHAIHYKRFAFGVTRTFEFLPFLPVLPVVALLLAFAKRLSVPAAMWVGVFVMSIPAALLPLSKDGGFDNDFMPIGLFIGSATAMLIIETARALEKWRALRELCPYVLGAGLAFFLVLRPYDVSTFVPSAAHWQAIERLNDLVAKLEGGVLAPCHPFLPIRNGHTNDQYSEMPYIDAYWSRVPDLALGKYLDDTAAEWVLMTGFEIAPSSGEIALRYSYVRGMSGTPPTLVGQSLRIQHMLRRRPERRHERLVFDFETPPGDDWRRVGAAFEHSPTEMRPKWQNAIYGGSGKHLANSFHPTLGDRATGTLTSPAFTIDHDRLSIDVGGGRGVGVYLEVEGRNVGSAHPTLPNKELLLGVTIDVVRFQGQSARIVLYDHNRGPWGHLLVDNVILYDP